MSNFEEKFRTLLAEPIDKTDRQGAVLQRYAASVMTAFSVASRATCILMLHESRADMDEATVATIDRLLADLDAIQGAARADYTAYDNRGRQLMYEQMTNILPQSMWPNDFGVGHWAGLTEGQREAWRKKGLDVPT